MQLLFISSQYPPYELGGYEQLCHEVTVGLRVRGHQVRVLTSRFGVQSLSEINSNEVTRSLFLQSDLNYYRPLDFFLKRSYQERANIRELKEIIAQFNPDLIMVWGMFSLSFNLPYWAERWLPGRVAYYIGSYWPMDLDLHRAYWQLPARRSLTELFKRPLRRLVLAQLRREGYPPELRFEHAVCASEYVRDKLVQAGKLPPSAGVLYGGTDPEPFLRHKAIKNTVKGETLRLLYFGRLVPDKGVHTAIEALGLLRQRELADDVDLTILGDGHPDYKSQLRQRVQELQLEDCVHFAGQVAREEIPAWLSRFDVFLFTSTWPEPFGRTIVEAMVAGLVVIGSEVGGSREIFQYYDEGMLFQPEDSQSLADRIMRVKQDPGLRQHLVNVGRQTALERFTLTHMIDEIEEYLLRISAKQNL
jgi:glycosyltransferase involved in cell wall biosynthesis